MKNKKNNLNGVKKVIFNDYSDYQSATCHTGGNYGFWTNYNRLPNGNWEVSYGTTADFSYCPVCGSFDIRRGRKQSFFMCCLPWRQWFVLHSSLYKWKNLDKRMWIRYNTW